MSNFLKEEIKKFLKENFYGKGQKWDTEDTPGKGIEATPEKIQKLLDHVTKQLLQSEDEQVNQVASMLKSINGQVKSGQYERAAKSLRSILRMQGLKDLTTRLYPVYAALADISGLEEGAGDYNHNL